MGSAPLITPAELRREAWHLEDVYPEIAGYLKLAAASIEFWKTAATELAQQEDER